MREAVCVLHGLGAETEAELPFAGLHGLFGGLAERCDALPEPQALRAALGLGARGSLDRFLVGLAVLTLLADLAEERPVLCVIDDAHWLDRSSLAAVLFAARRLRAERVALVLAVREGHAPSLETPGIAELRLGGLDDHAATRVVAHGAAQALAPPPTDTPADRPHLAHPQRTLRPAHSTDPSGQAPALSNGARRRILAEARGNPLALLALARREAAGHADGPRAARPGSAAPAHAPAAPLSAESAPGGGSGLRPLEQAELADIRAKVAEEGQRPDEAHRTLCSAATRLARSEWAHAGSVRGAEDNRSTGVAQYGELTRRAAHLGYGGRGTAGAPRAEPAHTEHYPDTTRPGDPANPTASNASKGREVFGASEESETSVPRSVRRSCAATPRAAAGGRLTPAADRRP